VRDLEHKVISDATSLSELAVSLEVHFGVVIKRGVHSLGISLDLFAKLFLGLLNTLVRLLLLLELLSEIVEIALQELNVRLTMTLSVKCCCLGISKKEQDSQTQSFLPLCES